MMYRRARFKNRHLPDNEPAQKAEVNKVEDIKEIPKIPLPNEAERAEDTLLDARGHSSSFITIFNHKIFLDEIILLGLLFILFAEGIEDEFLLIILLYLLLGDRLKDIIKI